MSPRQKWRPSLSLVVFLVLVSVLLLPLFSLYFLKLYQNQLIQQTESELIAQSAALAAVFKREVETAVPEGVALGTRIPPDRAKTGGRTVSSDLAEAGTGQGKRAAAAAAGAYRLRAGRSRLRRARRAHDAGSASPPRT